jgi:hypothetical protein
MPVRAALPKPTIVAAPGSSANEGSGTAAAPAEADASDAEPRPAFDEDPGELADPGEPRNPD